MFILLINQRLNSPFVQAHKCFFRLFLVPKKYSMYISFSNCFMVMYNYGIHRPVLRQCNLPMLHLCFFPLRFFLAMPSLCMCIYIYLCLGEREHNKFISHLCSQFSCVSANTLLRVLSSSACYFAGALLPLMIY